MRDGAGGRSGNRCQAPLGYASVSNSSLARMVVALVALIAGAVVPGMANLATTRIPAQTAGPVHPVLSTAGLLLRQSGYTPHSTHATASRRTSPSLGVRRIASEP